MLTCLKYLAFARIGVVRAATERAESMKRLLAEIAGEVQELRARLARRDREHELVVDALPGLREPGGPVLPPAEQIIVLRAFCDVVEAHVRPEDYDRVMVVAKDILDDYRRHPSKFAPRRKRHA